MTVVTGSFNVPGQSGLTGFSGSLWWVPTARHTSGSGIVLPVPFIAQVDSNGTMTPINVDPTGPTWVWKVTEQFNGIAQNVVRYVQVPASGTVAYKDLVDVDPNSLAPNAPVPGLVDGGTAALPNRFIQKRRDTAANWTVANPVLAAGEPGFESDTKRQKIGDGVTAWTALGYQFDKPIAETAADAKGLKASSKTWFDKSRRGIFVHCVYGGSGASVHTIKRDGTLPTSLDDLANNFDVTKLANNLASFGVDYVVFTAWHFAMYALYPSAVMNATLPGHATTTRDLLADLIAALKPKGIKVVFYVHPIDGADLQPAEQTATGWNDPTNNYATWANFINNLITECGSRYGNDLDGFWVDMVQDPNFSTRIVDKTRFRNSLKAGNPNRALIGNRGTSDASNVDYTLAALWNGVVDHSTHEYISWPATTSAIGNQNSTAAILGADWMSAQTETSGWSNGRNANDLFRYLVLNAGINKYGGGTIYAAGPYAGMGATSLWEPGIEAQFNAINALVAPVRESLHNVIPSASFPTANTVTLASLGTPGFVATRAADSVSEYIHILTPPASGTTIALPAPVDGAEFYAATNLRTGNPVTVTPTSTGINLTLTGSDAWDANDTVIKLARMMNYAERVWIPAGAFGTQNGAVFSSQSVNGRWAGWSLSPSTPMQVESNFSIPQHWNSFTLTIYMAQPSGATGTGVAVLSITQASAVPGGPTNVDGQAWGQSWTMPGDTVTLGALTPFTAINNAPFAIQHLRISRTAAGSNNGPTLAILGMMARRVS